MSGESCARQPAFRRTSTPPYGSSFVADGLWREPLGGAIHVRQPFKRGRVKGGSTGHRHRMAARDRVTITPYRDGPLLVRGPFTLVDQDGTEIEVDREVVALCRCGKSRIKPLCDSTHKTIGFKAPSRPAAPPARAALPEAS